jgi:hypothetical protein
MKPMSAAAQLAASVCRNANAPAVSRLKPSGAPPGCLSDASILSENGAALPSAVRYSRRSAPERIASVPATSNDGSARLCSR